MKLVALILVMSLAFCSVAFAEIGTPLTATPMLDPGDGAITHGSMSSTVALDPGDGAGPLDAYLFTIWGLSDVLFWM